MNRPEFNAAIELPSKHAIDLGSCLTLESSDLNLFDRLLQLF